MRSACVGEPFYKEHEGKRFCVLHFPCKEKSADFEKAFLRKLEKKDFNFRGGWFPDRLSFSNRDFDGDVDFSFATFGKYADFRSATFSVADFRSATFSAAADFTHSKFGEANFGNATFSELVSFNSATLGKLGKLAHFGDAAFGAEAIFYDAIFGAEANFYRATFSQRANFRKSTFRSANFGKVIFSAPADFSDATFSATADFKAATFSGPADFINCTLSGKTVFSDVTFRDYVRFAGKESKPVFSDTSSLDLQFARIEKADHLSFHTLSLRPHWFVNVDARKFDFINVHWENSGKAKPEIALLKSKGVSSPHRLLAIACRHIAVNAEENHRYEDSRRLQLRERMRGNLFVAHWRVLKKTSAKLHWSLKRDWGVRGRTLTRSKRFIRVYGKSLNLLYWLYWGVSGHGEK